MQDRESILQTQLKHTDGQAPDPKQPLNKHLKMAESPFRFLRGSAPLFYRDLAQDTLLPHSLLKAIPLCMIQGDCHLSNLGFFTEEGSHGDAVIFGLNDFDDACVGHAPWDLLRFATSLYLAQETLATLANDPTTPAPFDPALLPNAKITQKSVKAFFRSYLKTCQTACDKPAKRAQAYTRAITKFTADHVLRKPWKKATRRCAGGKQFLTKSALAKATHWTDNDISFADNAAKFAAVSPTERHDLIHHFEPFFDDTVLDVIERLDAGTGSVNMKRYYFLVGPRQARFPRDLALCHIVEVKKQRPAAPLHAFPTLSPTNRLNPAHLTQVCQRRMQRSPDLILDETYWQGAHWLVRSRHHAKVGIDPIDLLTPANKAGEAGITQYAKLCGHVLALAHMRSDRRSSAFETAITQHLPQHLDTLNEAAQHYAAQTQTDWALLRALLQLDPNETSGAGDRSP